MKNNNSPEVWVTCPRYPHMDISNRGACRRPATGKVLSPAPDVNGYIGYSLIMDGKRAREYAHKLVAEAFLPPHAETEEGWVVEHLDGNRANNRVENLLWMTMSARMKKHHAKGKKGAQ